eukprot:TRINITY_DN5279_c0_g2_i2.p1 TRINITY_DN5279_c0_g2~~TRINITY_DN5279_c0_g2_i2.p1  ORF type:complete len:368 (-),score=123.82 TRINITY_DN5279_c0_g2_i2:703-1806(-)
MSTTTSSTSSESTNVGKGTQVLVTGSTGFIGNWVVKLLLERGYKVRATTRSLKNTAKVEKLQSFVPDAEYPLEVVEGDLMEPGAFDEHVKGCKYVFHIASPYIMSSDNPEEEIVKPALEGTENVLKAVAAAGGVKRVVLTSSVVAIMSDLDKDGMTFDESIWNESASIEDSPYPYSKTVAEKFAWDFVKELPEEQKFELVTINPGAVLGPMLSEVFLTSSFTIISALLDEKYPGYPALKFCLVDVRDVALAHIKAAEIEEAEGRYACVGHMMWLNEIADHMSTLFPDYSFPDKDKKLPNWITIVASWFDSKLSTKWMKANLGADFDFDNSKIKKDLGIEFMDIDESLKTTGDSLIDRGVCKDKRTKE